MDSSEKQVRELGPVRTQSGAVGFIGEGYPYHKYLKPFGLTFERCTPVFKTTTLERNEGNMPLAADGITPLHFKPACIVCGPRQFLNGVVLNSVGLSGPGARALFETQAYEKLTDPFALSFMSIASSAEKRKEDFAGYLELLSHYKTRFKTSFILQKNESCPNIGKQEVSANSFIAEKVAELDLAYSHQIPIELKFSVTTPPELVYEVAAHPAFGGICISNTVAWKKLSEYIDWEQLFGTDISPLAHLGGGGLSGAPLLPIVCKWIIKLRKLGFSKHINAGGGILYSKDVDMLAESGADAISIGTIAMLRPWNMRAVIDLGYQRFSTRKDTSLGN